MYNEWPTLCYWVTCTYIVKLENDTVTQTLYRKYVEDTFNKRKVKTSDILFEKLNKYNPKIELTIELNPNKFLDAKLICVNGIYNTMVNRKPTKLPMAWSTKMPRRYKSNTFIGELHWSKRSFDELCWQD